MATARARAVSMVLDDHDSVLLIHRTRDGRSYSVLPGGGVEDREPPADAAIRELKEETGLDGRVERHLGTYRHADRIAHYYLVSVQPGTVRLGGPELGAQSEVNRHRPCWTLLSDLDTENLQPEEIRSMLRNLSRSDPDPRPDARPVRDLGGR